MAKTFYKIPEKEIKLAVAELEKDGILMSVNGGYIISLTKVIREHLQNAHQGMSDIQIGQ